MTKNMRVLVAAPYCINTPHFETELELIQNHLDSGDEVTLLGCNFSFLCCDVNPAHRKAVCLRCVGRRRAGLKTLNRQVTVRPLIKLNQHDQSVVRELASRVAFCDDIQELSISNFDIGYAVLSSLISMMREPRPNLRDGAVARNARNLLIAACSAYLSLKAYLTEDRYDRVYVYNGRYAITRAVLRACQLCGVDCYCHERGGALDRYALYENALPHDRERFGRNMKTAWNQANSVERLSVGASFYEERRAAIDQGWFSYVKGQDTGVLPELWDRSKRNVVIFGSSEDEFAAIGRQWEKQIYANQYVGIMRLASDFLHDLQWHFYLRVHPNLTGVRNSQTRQLSSIGIRNVTVIGADSRVSSYALMDAAEKVIVFGSTMGVEATYWGVPAILLGPAFYEKMDAVYEPTCHEEAVKMINATLTPKDKTAALVYGYYLKTYGTRFQYYEPEGVYTGKFKGRYIRENLVVRGVAMLDDAIRFKMSGAIRKVRVCADSAIEACRCQLRRTVLRK